MNNTREILKFAFQITWQIFPTLFRHSLDLHTMVQISPFCLHYIKSLPLKALVFKWGKPHTFLLVDSLCPLLLFSQLQGTGPTFVYTPIAVLKPNELFHSQPHSLPGRVVSCRHKTREAQSCCPAPSSLSPFHVPTAPIPQAPHPLLCFCKEERDVCVYLDTTETRPPLSCAHSSPVRAACLSLGP